MKKYKNLILYSIAILAIFALAIYSYKYLTQKYSSDEIENTNNIEQDLNKAPDFTVINNNGEEFKLSDFIGKPIVVNFWATWCRPCEIELPTFDNSYKKYKDEVEFLMVNLTDGYSETVDGVKNYINTNGYTFPVYFDTKYSAANAYAIYSIPRTLFIDENGDLVYSRIGVLSEEMLNKNIESLIKK